MIGNGCILIRRSSAVVLFGIPYVQAPPHPLKLT